VKATGAFGSIAFIRQTRDGDDQKIPKPAKPEPTGLM
jgi:hypothetical protein